MYIYLHEKCIKSVEMKISSYVYYLSMVVVQLVNGGSTILMKISFANGLNQFVFIVYRHLIATLILAPFAYVLEKKERPRLSFGITMKIFLVASIGTTMQLNVYAIGLAHTSATIASALSNVVPSLTFLIALLLRMEKVNMKSWRGKAKVIGTLVCISGSLICTFWKDGFKFKGFVKKPLIDVTPDNHNVVANNNTVQGSALIFISYIAYSAWLILQAIVYKIYPAPLSMNVLTCFFASIQSSFLSLFWARDINLWKLHCDEHLLTIIYGGLMISGFGYITQLWCISSHGPVFVAMFIPLQLLVAAIFSACFFAERIHLGSLIGAILIVGGLYSVLWGKKTDNPDQGRPSDQTEKSTRDDDQIVEIRVKDCVARDDVESKSQASDK